ncbi:MAG: N-carbamoylputrescine amidase [Pseudomonadota bacterium]
MRPVTLAATQMACSWDIDDNIARAEGLVRAAAEAGAQVILLQELFETPYFCITQDYEHLHLARPLDDSRVVSHFRALAKELGVVLPVSFFEQAGLARFNALAVFDADGAHRFTYRKSHIPQFPGYEEKFYFSPGDTGFEVVETRFGRLGCGICWDQWFPEASRAMALKGAEILLFPTAIGTEPAVPELDSAGHWRRTMQGHAAANIMPLIASNRVGHEATGNVSMDFYGTSFIAGYTGEILAEADREEETVLTATVDLDEAEKYRVNWGVFRDRRPDLYGALTSLDGTSR